MAKKKHQGKLWGGGYAASTASAVERFTQSISFDRRLAACDIRGSIVHARMLARRRIIPTADARKIERGLTAIGREIAAGKFRWDPALEDVHMNVESALTRRIGDAGARLHTGRSRNDQVATAFRLWCADAAEGLEAATEALDAALAQFARRYGRAIICGYTHLQQAQPVTVAAYASAYREMLRRDAGRLAAARDAALDECPLGAGALAGSTLPLDRKFTARQLGFRAPSRSTMDAVSNRDFAVELLSACSLLQVHLSRLAEDLIIYSSKEFGFIRLHDSVTTGSSLMPQKKNPDIAELVRGKTGRVIGHLTGLLVTLKGLPLTYNRDMQEDKEPVFDAVDTVLGSLEVMALAVRTMRFDAKRARDAIDPTVLATDLAEHLVEQGVPFRHAHEIVARFVHSGGDLSGRDAAALRRGHPALANAGRRLSLDEAVRRRKLPTR